MAKLPDIPSIGTSEASVGVRRVFDAIRRAFTDINKSGGVETGASVLDKIESAINAGSGSTSVNTPPKPANVVATGGFAYIMVSWDDPHFIHLAYAEVWRSTGTEIIDATRVGTTNATMFSDLPPAQSISVSYNYWVRFVSNDDTPQYGPWSDMVTASTANDPAYVMELLSGEITATQLHQDLVSRIDLIDAPSTGLVDRVQVVTSNVANLATSQQTLSSRLDTGDIHSAIVNTQTTASTAYNTANTANSTANTAQYNVNAMASTVTTLQTTVGGHTSSISTLQSSVNGINAQYTVKLGVGGKVSGFGLMNSGTSSLFEILSDRFAICNTSGGGAKFPFIVDSTYGVMMDTALIKDGTITNAKIASLAADKLYATSGTIASAIIGYGQITNVMIGQAAITTAKIQDLAVDTLKIAGNAVTLAVASYISSGITAQSNTAQVSTVRITTSGQPVIISISFKFVSTPNGTINASGAVSCSRSGSTLVSIPLPTYINYSDSTTKLAMDSVFTYVYYDYPGAGTYDYTISLSSYSNVPITASARSMYVMEVKK